MSLNVLVKFYVQFVTLLICTKPNTVKSGLILSLSSCESGQYTLLSTVLETLGFRDDTGYPHDGRADKDSYPHDGRADKDSYPHDGRADKNPYRHDRHMQSF